MDTQAMDATEKQMNFLWRLLDERDDQESGFTQRCVEVYENGQMNKQAASMAIDWLLARPYKNQPSAPVTGSLEPGLYERDGEVYILKQSRETDRLYAKRAVAVENARQTEQGEDKKIDYEYAPGMASQLRPVDRIDLERAKELSVVYGACCVCGRTLKVAESVERGLGPVCALKI